MAKVAFTKLGLKKVDAIKKITINNIEIEVKQYLPIDDKIKIITNVLENSADDNNFSNPVKVDVYTCLEIIYAYTNMTFTERQKGDPTKLFDLLEENNIINTVINAMDEIEYKTLFDWIQNTITAYYKYKNSVLGILETISADYSNLKLEASDIQKKIADPQNLSLLKDVLTKLG